MVRKYYARRFLRQYLLAKGRFRRGRFAREIDPVLTFEAYH